MLPDVFSRPVPHGCLSTWLVSQAALDVAPTAVLDHTAVCAACAARVQSEKAEVAAARYEAVPPIIHERVLPRTPRRRRFAWLAVPALSLMGVTALFMLSPKIPETHLKGPLPLSVSVKREAALLVSDAPLELVGKLQPGDRIRLRVQREDLTRVQVQGLEGEAWQTYFDGRVPLDGWLPVGITITEGGKTQLRVVLCTKDGCDAPRVVSF